jgi:hypothetical protein
VVRQGREVALSSSAMYLVPRLFVQLLGHMPDRGVVKVGQNRALMSYLGSPLIPRLLRLPQLEVYGLARRNQTIRSSATVKMLANHLDSVPLGSVYKAIRLADYLSL